MRVRDPAAVGVVDRLLEDGHESGHGDEVDLVALQGVDQPLGVGQPVEVGAERLRSTSSTGIPAPSATSTARHGRSTTTTPMGRAAAIIDSRIVPLPDANTPIRRTLASYPRAACRARDLASAGTRW